MATGCGFRYVWVASVIFGLLFWLIPWFCCCDALLVYLVGLLLLLSLVYSLDFTVLFVWVITLCCVLYYRLVGFDCEFVGLFLYPLVVDRVVCLSWHNIALSMIEFRWFDYLIVLGAYLLGFVLLDNFVVWCFRFMFGVRLDMIV